MNIPLLLMITVYPAYIVSMEPNKINITNKSGNTLNVSITPGKIKITNVNQVKKPEFLVSYEITLKQLTAKTIIEIMQEINSSVHVSEVGPQLVRLAGNNKNKVEEAVNIVRECDDKLRSIYQEQRPEVNELRQRLDEIARQQ